MLITDISIKRPVFAIVISLLLITFGIIAYLRLPLREYPDIDTPVITIRTSYVGASASVVETKITQVIEDGVSGLEGLKIIESSSEDGQSEVSLEFDVDRDIDQAANDVRDKVSKVSGDLPDEAGAPEISKKSSGGMADLMMGLIHPTMTSMELTEYADRYLLDRFSVVDGVASAQVLGEKRYSMRIWLDRIALAARGLTVDDIENALGTENVELPAGRLESQDREFSLRVRRGYRTPSDFQRLVIARGADGYLVRLADVARIEVAPETLRDSFIADGKNLVGIGVSRQSKANTLTMIKGVKAVMTDLKPDLPKGMELIILRDSSVFIEAAVREVLIALVLAVVLVVGIIYLFLGSVRAALVPAVTIPIAVVATSTVLYPLGFSTNLLTLLALVLAIGLLVDDSIVVLENIHRRIEEGEPPLLAAYRGAKEVAFAVIATTVVLLAVFVPISLMEGDMGKLFTEFAFAMSGAVCFSSVVALTLSPMLCSRILKPREAEGRLGGMIDAAFLWTGNRYEWLLRHTVRHPYASLFILLMLCGLAWVLIGRLQSELEPQEDRGVLIVHMTAPEGTSFNAAQGYAQNVSSHLEPLLEGGEARHVLSITPGSRNSQGAVNSSVCIVELQPWEKRERTATQIARELFAKLATVTGVRVFVMQPAGLTMFFGQPVQFVIGGSTYEELVKWRDIMLVKARAYPGLISVQADYEETTPQYRVAVDRERAAELGVSAQTIGRTLETVLGSRKVTTYVDNGEEYNVILQGADGDRRTPSDLQNIHVRSTRSGELIPLSNLVSMEEQADAGTLKRHNRIRAITISGSMAEGYSIGDCLAFLEKTAREELPPTATVSYKGQSQKFKETGSSIVFVFLMGMVISYLVLAAQFESFVSPFVIMLTVPMGLVGAVIGMRCLGITLNIYSEIGLIMLIGLASKNGILIVEFANQLRDRGVPFEDAVFQASRLRLRPVAMTGLSTAIGALPLMLTTGAGAVSRMALGVVIACGATSACLLTLFVVPVGYFYLSRSQASPRELERRLNALQEKHGEESIAAAAAR
jgi:multidrug efflux pump